MKFDFFTFGGFLFWEDVFFYQKWRIQRHCITKKYRLLDSWDIRRESGNFEDCQKAFIDCINCYEITKQPKHLVILLHGYMDSKNIFKNLWRKFVLTKSSVAALNYPSTFRNSLAVAHQLLFFLNHTEDVEEVSFVTKGCGNLVLRNALNLPLKSQTFRETMRIRNIVEINPVVKGCFLCELLGRYKIFRFLLGPMIDDMTEKKIENLPSIPSDICSLKIFSKSKTFKMLINILRLCRFPVNEDKNECKDCIYIEGDTFKTLNNEKILNYTVKFINNGKI